MRGTQSVPAEARREAVVQTLGVIDDAAATLPYAVAAASPLWIPDHEQALPGLRLPEDASAAAEPSWEQMVVDAGLDRESREWSPAERVLADQACGITAQEE